jgi:hypothetical protein
MTEETKKETKEKPLTDSQRIDRLEKAFEELCIYTGYKRIHTKHFKVKNGDKK